MKILIVDDIPKNIQVVANILHKYELLFALSGEEALKILNEEKNIDLILLDVMMPKMDGFEVCKHLRRIREYENVPVIFLTAKDDADNIIKGFDVGGQDYITKPFHTKELLSRVTNFLKLKSFEDSLQEKIDDALNEIYLVNQEIIDTQKEVIFTMGAIGETRSKETGQHVKRVAEYSFLFAELYGLPKEECNLIKMASPMHDIGKVGISDDILNKPAKLTSEERRIMMRHSKLGYEMLKHSKRPILNKAASIALTHHEKWDGTGYPQNLKEDAIPIEGRITAIADVFDALGSERCYKKAWPDDKIFSLIKEESGKHFDPVLVDIFFQNLDSFLKIRSEYQDVF